MCACVLDRPWQSTVRLTDGRDARPTTKNKRRETTSQQTQDSPTPPGKQNRTTWTHKNARTKVKKTQNLSVPPSSSTGTPVEREGCAHDHQNPLLSSLCTATGARQQTFISQEKSENTSKHDGHMHTHTHAHLTRDVERQGEGGGREGQDNASRRVCACACGHQARRLRHTMSKR